MQNLNLFKITEIVQANSQKFNRNTVYTVYIVFLLNPNSFMTYTMRHPILL